MKVKLNKINSPICLIDMGINSMYAINSFHEILDKENIVYLNDLNIDNYEGKEIDFIEKRIALLLERALKLNPKMIVIVNDTIIEYGKEQLDKLNIPYVNIVDEIINYVNLNFEFKNMAFFAPQGIIEANMYQKNFHYTRLYNLNADSIMKDLNSGLMKTNESFNDIRLALLPLYKKEIDCIIPSLINILLFRTEINEYIKDDKAISIIDASTILALKAKEILENNNITNEKMDKKKYVYLILNKKRFKKNKDIYNKIINCKKKVIEEEVEEIEF